MAYQCLLCRYIIQLLDWMIIPMIFIKLLHKTPDEVRCKHVSKNLKKRMLKILAINYTKKCKYIVNRTKYKCVRAWQLLHLFLHGGQNAKYYHSKDVFVYVSYIVLFLHFYTTVFAILTLHFCIQSVRIRRYATF